MPDLRRLVLDTNVVLRGLASEHSVGARILDAADKRRFIVLLSKPLLSEYRAILLHPEILKRFPSITPHRVRLQLDRLRYIGDYYPRVKTKFSFPRDPGDEPLIELSIEGHATHLLTYDPDILSLPENVSDAGRRFRRHCRKLQIIEPGQFLRGI